ncbi:MAG: STAS domain-containing protein [Calditrichia bacterium]
MEQILIKTEFIDKTLPVVLVEIGGYIDQSNCDQLQKVFDNLFSSNHFNLIFDLKNLVYMSSAGWGIFVGEVKRFREHGGDIKLLNMTSEVYEIFQMLEFYYILEDYNSLSEVLIAYGITPPKEYQEENASNGDLESKKDVSFLEQSQQFLLETDKFFPEKDTEAKKPLDKKEVDKDKDRNNNKPIKQTISIDLTALPVQEKIRKIISQYPLLSVRQISGYTGC